MQYKYQLTLIKDYNYKILINDQTNHNYQEILYNILLKFVNGYKNKETLFFNAESIQNLDNFLKKYNYFLPEHLCIKLVDDLSKQINYLLQYNISIYGLDLDDIIVINECTFIIVSTVYFLPIESNIMHIYLPPKMPYFGNPELYAIKTLPNKLTIKSLYYSIGVLVTFCLTNNYLLVGNEIKSNKEIKQILQYLKGRKIYWFLLRCLEDEPNNRHLLLI